MSQKLPGMADQHRQELVLGRSEMYLGSAAEHLRGSEIYLERTHLEHRIGRRARRLAGMTEGHPDPRQQLVHSERFREIVVGAEVERRDLDLLPPAGRENDDR